MWQKWLSTVNPFYHRHHHASAYIAANAKHHYVMELRLRFSGRPADYVKRLGKLGAAVDLYIDQGAAGVAAAVLLAPIPS